MCWQKSDGASEFGCCCCALARSAVPARFDSWTFPPTHNPLLPIKLWHLLTLRSSRSHPPTSRYVHTTRCLLPSRSSPFPQQLTHPPPHPAHQLARRLRFPTPPSFSTLSSKILSLWSASTPLTAQNIGLSYVDADGDRCVLSSDEELQDLYADLRAEARAEEVLKIRVVVLGKEEGGEDGLGERGMEMVEREGEGEETPQAERESERLDGGAQEDKVDVEMQVSPFRNLYISLGQYS